MTPSEETPPDETPLEETPLEETPAEETPPEEAGDAEVSTSPIPGENQSEALEDFVAQEPAIEESRVDATPIEPTRIEDFAKEDSAMNEHAQDAKRDAGTPEDQSRQAAHEAKDASLQAFKANDAAAIAKADLTRRKAISAHAAALHDAERTKELAQAEKERVAQQLDSASKVRRHCQNMLNETNAQVQVATEHYGKLKMALDQAEADMKAASALAVVKGDEYAASQKVEGDLKTRLAELETANETYELAKATADVTLATAKSDYAQEIAKIKKEAANRDMTSFAI
jgi:hypothetical protein